MNWSSIVGLDLAKQALLLLAADPSLAGMAMAASVGSGKSTLARAFAALLPERTPFVELPLNATEDRLLGGLDFEATLATGARVIEPGLLHKAHGGVLYVDALNLLDTSTANQIMDVMSRGEVRVEREGANDIHPARFMLVGTYDPTDGDVRGGLLDRIGLIVPFAPNQQAEARAAVVRGNRAGSAGDDDDEAGLLRGMIAMARELLPTVSATDAQLEGLARAAIELGVQGNRADVFAAKAAVAHAALNGRDSVDDEDLQLAARLVLLPRATRLPEPESEPKQQPPQSQQPQPQPEDSPDSDDDESRRPPPEEAPSIEDMVLTSLESDLPADVLSLPFAAARRGRSGSRGSQLNLRRGRFVRATPGELRGGKLALVQTLLAAAPWQPARRKEALSKSAHARTRIAFRADDIRVKHFRDKTGALFIFVVDASGSMALNRMRQAKGAVARLLQNAYVHRDQVALIAFRGAQAQVLLPPSQSVERAKRELDVLPTGGGTPLANALLLAWQTAQQARRKCAMNTTLVLMTDGRANVALNADAQAAGGKAAIEQELAGLAALIADDGVHAIVIDTQANYLSRGEAPRLAQALRGRYVYLPNARAEEIASVLAAAPASP